MQANVKDFGARGDLTLTKRANYATFFKGYGLIES